MVTKDTLMIDLEKNIPQTDQVFSKYGMGHIGTLIAFFNTIEETAIACGLNPDLIVMEINKLPASKRYRSPKS